MPGSSSCIFPDSPTDLVPVLDYSAAGVGFSLKDSLKRLGVTSVYGLRVHDAEDALSVSEAMSTGGCIDELVRTIFFEAYKMTPTASLWDFVSPIVASLQIGAHAQPGHN